MHASSTHLSLATLFASALLLAACKDEPKVFVKTDGETSIVTGSDGAIVNSAGDGESLALSTELPAFAPAYPGARLRTQVSDGKTGGRGGLVVFETADPVEKVAAFYDARAQELGVKPGMVVNEKDSAVRIFAGRDGKDKAGGALVAISRSEKGLGTEIVITAGMADAHIRQMEKDKDAWRESANPIRLQ